MEISKPDRCGSVRYTCQCGTHFNSDPKNKPATRKWLKKHLINQQ